MKKPLSRVLLGMATLVAISLIAFGAKTKWWQRWDYDADWAKANAACAIPILIALEQFKQERGSYPENLEQVSAGLLTETPAPVQNRRDSTSGQWRYEREADGEYRLWLTAHHWVSSYDALVYRPSRTYPASWRANHCFDVDGWLYVVGFSNVQKTGR